ncbi:MAG: hypothetical protein AB1641_14615 [Thermodesulfobacteriota bacterium]
MKENKSISLTVIALLSLIPVFGRPAWAAPDYTGAWTRQAKYVNNNPAGSYPAFLVLGETAFNSIVQAPPDQACAFTGVMTVQGGQMKVRVAVSSCSARIPEGSERVYQFTLSPDGRTLTTRIKEGQDDVKEVYQRTSQTSGSQGCRHPFCGTWMRIETYTGNELVHTEPAATVITDDTYYSVAASCYNSLTIKKVEGTTVTMVMIGHNCPTPPGFMPPGFQVTADWRLSDDGQQLIIVDTNYGVAVKTVFKRIK